MDDYADWRLNRQRHAVHQRVRHADGLDCERPDGELFARLNLDQLGLIQKLVLVELAFNVGESELGCIDGNFELGENPGQATDVVFVPVGQDDGPDAGLVFDQVGNVGDNNIDAEELGFREHQARVDHDNFVLPAKGQAVHAELAQTAKRNDFQLISLHLSVLMLPPALPAV